MRTLPCVIPGIIVCLVGCTGDITTNPPAALSEQPSPAFAYTNPTAQVTDGSGNGTLYTAPNDPTPNAPGIWLGNAVSSLACYRNHNPIINDSDNDWLADNCEFELAKAFAPVLEISSLDACPHGEPYWAAKYFDAPNVTGAPETVRIIYMPAYYEDCGTMGHHGDSEVIMLGIWENPQTRHWEVRNGFLSAHRATENDASDWLTTDFEYPARPLAYPKVYVALDKHGNYRSYDQCEHRAPIQNDSCIAHVPEGRIIVLPSRNVGSRFVNFFPNGVVSSFRPSSPARLEYFYQNGTESFRGWSGLTELGSGATPFADIIKYQYFDNYHLNTIVRYAGPGPNPPAETITRGVFDGPSTVTANLPASWSTYVSGGTGPYTTTWERSDGGGWQVIGNTSGSGPSAGTLNYVPSNCLYFSMRATFRSSGDGQLYTTPSRTISVTCPPSVSLSGPGIVNVKGIYSYIATTVGLSNATFLWKERFCASPGVCGGWSSLSGTPSYTRSLTPDCSGSGTARFELEVYATSGGTTKSATISTALCSSEPL